MSYDVLTVYKEKREIYTFFIRYFCKTAEYKIRSIRTSYSYIKLYIYIRNIYTHKKNFFKMTTRSFSHLLKHSHIAASSSLTTAFFFFCCYFLLYSFIIIFFIVHLRIIIIIVIILQF